MLLSCFLSAIATSVALPTTTGKEWELWTKGGYCVIVARVREVRPSDAGETRPDLATIEPVATLAGLLDPSERRTMDVGFYSGGIMTSIEQVPQAGSMILAVVRLKDPEYPEDRHWIVSDICTFMPGQSALVVISGLEDPKVAATLKKIQGARANPDPSPYGKPTTQRAR